MGSNSWTCKNLELKKNKVSFVLKSQAITQQVFQTVTKKKKKNPLITILIRENINC